MDMLDEKSILKAKSYQDIFSNDKNIAKKQFREYCKLYHPDVGKSRNAKEVFAKLVALYNSTGRKPNPSAENNTVKFQDASTKKGFEFHNPVVFANGACTVYHIGTKIALSFPEDKKGFAERYLQAVASISYANSEIEKEFKILFPAINRHFVEENGNTVILLNKTNEVKNLEIILNAYKANGRKFPKEHAAWILNRLYNIATYMSFHGYAFNGFTLANMWVSPEYHTVLPLGGWEYQEKLGNKMAGCPREVYNVLPIYIKDSHLSDTGTDLESIKEIGRKLFEGSDATHVLAFLDEGISKGDGKDADGSRVLGEWRLYGEAVKKDFGKRKFVVWEDVPYIQ